MIITYVDKNLTNDYSQNKRVQAMIWVTYKCTQTDKDADYITVRLEDLKVVTSFFVQAVSPNDPEAPNAVSTKWEVIEFSNTNEITISPNSIESGIHPGQIIKIFATGY